MESKFSLYENKEGRSASDLSIDNYIGMVLHGSNQDLVLEARSEKQKGNLERYKELKSQSKCITGSAVFERGMSKQAKNIKLLNNLIVIDIDVEISKEQFQQLNNDKYTFIIHKSFGGDGLCIFVKIDSNRFEDSFDGLADYYYNTYNIAIDQSCKNKNRLRYISFDPDIYRNDKANKFTPKNVKKFADPKSTETNYVFHPDDFDNILSQIKDRNIDLCQEDYHRYLRIGLSLANQFGALGEDKFHFVCSFGSKYDCKSANKHYKSFVENADGKCGIGTFYYYCKQAGIDIYTPKTKTIINKVKVGKSQGTPTVLSICSNLKVANHIDANEADKEFINELILSNRDYSKEANEDLSEIEQVEKFILDVYDPYYDEISNYIFVNGSIMEEKELNDIYLKCKKSFYFNIPLSDIASILNSNLIPKKNRLKEFISENKSNPIGVIDSYANLIHPRTEYNVWAFKKWIVGAVHNWLSDKNERLVSPLTLVLTGQKHGTGKTSFFRNMLPDVLSDYFIQEKINGKDKDSMYRLCAALLIFDDEFGGDGFKDVKAFKSVSDISIVTQRRPFARQDSIFKRISALCGTTNEKDILRDITGNRRILPLNVESIDYNLMLEINKIDLIIEAYNLYKAGFDWIIRTQEDIDYIKSNTQQNESILPIEEIFLNHFSLSHSINYPNDIVINQGELLEYLNIHSPLKPTKFELRDVLTKNKLDYTTHRVSGDLKRGIKLFVKPSFDFNRL